MSTVTVAYSYSAAAMESQSCIVPFCITFPNNFSYTRCSGEDIWSIPLVPQTLVICMCLWSPCLQSIKTKVCSSTSTGSFYTQRYQVSFKERNVKTLKEWICTWVSSARNLSSYWVITAWSDLFTHTNTSHWRTLVTKEETKPQAASNKTASAE